MIFLSSLGRYLSFFVVVKLTPNLSDTWPDIFMRLVERITNTARYRDHINFMGWFTDVITYCASAILIRVSYTFLSVT
jgi:hypothetical protein